MGRKVQPENWVITTSIGLRQNERRALAELAQQKGVSRSRMVARLVAPDLFGSPLLASAGLDRLTHRAPMIVITGSSFRAHGTQDPGKEVPTESTT
jgi:hypothetical protein